MNKVSLATMIALALAAGAVQAQPNGSQSGPSDPTGTVHFYGKVFTNSCKIIGNDKNLRVHLPVVMDLDVTDQSAIGVKKFTINVRDCPNHGNYKPRLAWDVPQGDVTADGYLRNKVGSAKNVALMLMNKDQRPIDLSQTDIRIDADKDFNIFNNPTYTFNVGYIKADRQDRFVMPGSVNTYAKYSITYR